MPRTKCNEKPERGKGRKQGGFGQKGCPRKAGKKTALGWAATVSQADAIDALVDQRLDSAAI